jgi:hypothetical protein
MATQPAFPKFFRALIGQHHIYSENGTVKCSGTVQDIRWSSGMITKLKKNRAPGPYYYGIELKIKPEGSRARWTRAFNSGIKVKS